MKLAYLSAAKGFLEAKREGADHPEVAQAVIVPYRLEKSVSYGSGTAKGPEAILLASHQLELFDDELECEPYRNYGVATLSPPPLPESMAAAIDQLSYITDLILSNEKFPLILGGEHALTPGAVLPFLKRYKDLVVLHIDSHADLRDGYNGEHYSHASAIRRVLDYPGVSVVSVGIRSVSLQEVLFYRANRDRITIWWAKDQTSWKVEDIVSELVGRPIYVTCDVDGLDSALMPATGTPTPGGMSYWQVLDLLKEAAKVGRIVGGDVVELAPISGLHSCDYTAAAIVYKILNYALYGVKPSILV